MLAHRLIYVNQIDKRKWFLMTFKDKFFLNAEEFQKLLCVSPNKFRELERAGKLPKSVALGPRSKRWATEVIQAWLKNNGGAA